MFNPIISPPDALTEKPEETLWVASLLTLAGGALDAFTYVGHGGVFANAMTGNVVLLAVHLAQGQWDRANTFLVPLVAYLCGVVVAYVLKEGPFQKIVPYPARTSLALEVVILAWIAAVPGGLSDMAAVVLVAFSAALQGASFTTLRGFAYTSVTTTGNVRRFAETFLAALVFNRSAESRAAARAFGQICLCFISGAVIGSWATRHWHDRAVLVPALLLASALVLCLPWNKPIQRMFKAHHP